MPPLELPLSILMGRRVDPPLSLTECASQLTGSLFFIKLSATPNYL